MARAGQPLDNLYRDVFALLLDSANGYTCELSIFEIFEMIGKKYCEDVQVLHKYLQQCHELFDISKGGDVTVKPRTSLTFCSTHSRKPGSCLSSLCADLHICIFQLLSGKCQYGEKCIFGHNIRTDHNLRLLLQNRLSGITMIQLRTLLCLPWVRKELSVPSVCRYYNIPKGCSKRLKCHCLHLCRYYLRDDCKFGLGCDRNHDIRDVQVKNVLSMYGIKVTDRKLSDVLNEVKEYEREFHPSNDFNDDEEDEVRKKRLGFRSLKTFGSFPDLSSWKHTSRHADLFPGSRLRSVSRRRPLNQHESSKQAHVKTEKLCYFNLQSVCCFKGSCKNLHSSQPFLWRFALTDNGIEELQWFSLDEENNLNVERQFCQPDVTECTVKDRKGTDMLVNFRRDTAQYPSLDKKCTVKRLAIENVADRRTGCSRPETSMATVWLWYWHQGDTWKEFGLEKKGTSESTGVTSVEIEKQFQLNAKTKITFGHFILDFEKMRLRNTKSETHRPFKVRRRPKFQLKNDDCEDGYSSNTSRSDDDGSNEIGSDDSQTENKVVCHQDNVLPKKRKTDDYDAYPDERKRPGIENGLSEEEELNCIIKSLLKMELPGRQDDTMPNQRGRQAHLTDKWRQKNLFRYDSDSDDDQPDMMKQGQHGDIPRERKRSGRSCVSLSEKDQLGSHVDWRSRRETTGGQNVFQVERERTEAHVLDVGYNNGREQYDPSVPLGVAASDAASVTQDQFLVELTSCKEYEIVRKRFTETLGVAATVIRIQKVKNPKLAARYEEKKQDMHDASVEKSVVEKDLYYVPPSSKAVAAISSSGVDCYNYKGSTVKTKPLGKGAHFHVNAAQAHKTCKGSGRHVMFQMKCLVGKWAQGHSALAMPPPVDHYQPFKKVYDSCVDDVVYPKMFVIFDSRQICPSYLITYQLT